MEQPYLAFVLRDVMSFVVVAFAFASVAFASAAFVTCTVDVVVESSQRDVAEITFVAVSDTSCIAEDSFASSVVAASFAVAVASSSFVVVVDIVVAFDFELVSSLVWSLVSSWVLSWVSSLTLSILCSLRQSFSILCPHAVVQS